MPNVKYRFTKAKANLLKESLQKLGKALPELKILKKNKSILYKSQKTDDTKSKEDDAGLKFRLEEICDHKIKFDADALRKLIEYGSSKQKKDTFKGRTLNSLKIILDTINSLISKSDLFNEIDFPESSKDSEFEEWFEEVTTALQEPSSEESQNQNSQLTRSDFSSEARSATPIEEGLQTSLNESIDFKPYLSFIQEHYKEKYYVPLRVTKAKEKYSFFEHYDVGKKQPDSESDLLTELYKSASNHILLVGQPGSGKSTFLRHLLLQEAEKALRAIERDETDFKIPILIELRYLQEETIVSKIHKILRRLQLDLGEVEKLLLEGRFLLLFDGVNEVPTSRWLILNEFQHEQDFHLNPRIFTTRDIEISASLKLESIFNLLPLTETQIRELVNYRLLEQTSFSLDQLKKPLKELAKTPLMLNILCDIAETDSDFFYIANQNEIFLQGKLLDRYRDHLLNKKNPDYIPNASNESIANFLLKQLSFKMTKGHSPKDLKLQISKEEAIIFFQEFLQDKGETDALSKANKYLQNLLKWGLIKNCSNSIFISNFNSTNIEFQHQLLQEYYVAEAILPIVKSKPDKKDIELDSLMECIGHSSWQEIFLLLADLLDDPIDLVRLIKTKIDQLISKNYKLERLLIWSKEKSDYIQPFLKNIKTTSDKRNEDNRLKVSVQAFYCASAVNHALRLNRAQEGISDYVNKLLVTLNPNFTLENMFSIALNYNSEPKINYKLVRDHALNTILSLIHDLHQKFSSQLKFDYSTDILYPETLSSLLSDLLNNSNLNWESDIDLYKALLLLSREDLLFRSRTEEGVRLEQWVSNLETWENNLRESLIKSGNISHNDWCFSAEGEIDEVKSYFGAVILLVKIFDGFELSRSNSEMDDEIRDFYFLPGSL